MTNYERLSQLSIHDVAVIAVREVETHNEDFRFYKDIKYLAMDGVIYDNKSNAIEANLMWLNKEYTP